MRLTFNLRHLEKKNLHLEGELSPATLDLENLDELIQVTEPVRYDLWVERLSQSILVHGHLRFVLDCECGRCLKPYRKPVEIEDWAVDLPLEGEGQMPVDNDCADLTPFIREDILLAFPQHPLCDVECSGLPNAPQKTSQPESGATQTGDVSSAWSELNKLKF